MKLLNKYAGLILILAGVMLMVLLHFLHITFLNWLLFIPLLLVIAGVVLHVWREKKETI
jgi:uncharacterized membrane protein